MIAIGTASRSRTAGGLAIELSRQLCAAGPAYDELLRALDQRRGLLMQCSTTYPGRYRPQWQGFVDPALQVVCRGGTFLVQALSPGGLAPLQVAADALDLSPAAGEAGGALERVGGAFGLLRRLSAAFACSDLPELGLYCALGYDLALDHYGLARRQARNAAQKDALFYLPESLLLCRDPASGEALRVTARYGPPAGRTPPSAPAAWPPIRPWPLPPEPGEPPAGHYRGVVARAREACRSGALFEVVAGQSFRRRSPHAPSTLYRRLHAINPSPYGFLANLEGEHLVGCSPEIFLRVQNGFVESAPISGTVRRGPDALADAERTRSLLESPKAEAELTMCSDVDRNDKASVCLPGSITLLGRRQIETYSHLIHTVDHIRGRLRPDCDAIDALQAHLWSVTLTGAPRPAAMAFIEANENAPRRWYGGAIGRLGLDGSLDSGIVLRALQLVGDLAEVRVGASLLHSSDPEDEERETLVKAAAMFDALAAEEPSPPTLAAPSTGGARSAVALFDFGGPFPALLQQMLEQAGHTVERPERGAGAGAATCSLLTCGGDEASQEAARRQARALLAGRSRVVAIGHGMLALAEALGARSRPLDEPQHGACLRVGEEDPGPDRALAGLLPPGSGVGCYHRAVLDPESLPAGLRATLRAVSGEILAISTDDGRAKGILFHPESLLTWQGLEIVAELSNVS